MLNISPLVSPPMFSGLGSLSLFLDAHNFTSLNCEQNAICVFLQGLGSSFMGAWEGFTFIERTGTPTTSTETAFLLGFLKPGIENNVRNIVGHTKRVGGNSFRFALGLVEEP